MAEDNHIIIGRRATFEALKSGMPLTRVIVYDGVERDSSIEDVLKRAERAHVRVEFLPKKAFEAACGNVEGHASQGVAADAPPFPYVGMHDVIAAANARAEKGAKDALVVVCDHITDAGNLGAIVRSAESVGASGVVIPNARSAQVTAATYKTSAGAVAHVPIARVPNLKRALQELKDAGFWVVGATEHAEDLLWDTDMTGRMALVMGNEHDGISELVLKNCDLACRLPQEGAISSLNVAQASTVFMYEWLRQNHG